MQLSKQAAYEEPANPKLLDRPSYMKYVSSLFQRQKSFYSVIRRQVINSYNASFCGGLIANVGRIQLQIETGEVAIREHVWSILPFRQSIYGLSAWYVPSLSSFLKNVFGASDLNPFGLAVFSTTILYTRHGYSFFIILIFVTLGGVSVAPQSTDIVTRHSRNFFLKSIYNFW